MFKMQLSILLIFFSLKGLAQKNDIVIPMKKGKVYYERSYGLDSNLKQDVLFNRALKWFKQDFPNTEKIKTESPVNAGFDTLIGALTRLQAKLVALKKTLVSIK